MKEQKKWFLTAIIGVGIGILAIGLWAIGLYVWNGDVKESLSRMLYSQRWKFIFDQEFYYFVGQYGYSANMDYAFFPLLPQLVSCFKGGKLDYWGAILVNNLLKILSGYLILLCLNQKQTLSKSVVMWSLLFWSLSPIGLFTSILYAESLFVFCTLFSFYLLYYKKSYFFGGVWAGLSALARPIGFVWCAAIMIHGLWIYHSDRQLSKIKSLIKCFIPMGLLAMSYPVYLWIRTGDGLKFLTVQYEQWHKKVGWFFQGFWYDLSRFQDYTLEAKLMVVFALIGVVVILMVSWEFWKQRQEPESLICWIYLILAFLVITNAAYKVVRLQAATSSQFRYLFSLFPIYLSVPSLPKFKRMGVVGIGVLMCGLTVYFFLLERYLC